MKLIIINLILHIIYNQNVYINNNNNMNMIMNMQNSLLNNNINNNFNNGLIYGNFKVYS